MLITKTIRIDMGHRVPNHKSKCRNLHGHSYEIEVGVDDKVIDTKGTCDEGMVIDFGDLKQIMMDYIDNNFDHGFVMYENDILAHDFRGYQEGRAESADKEHEGLYIADIPKQKIIFVPFVPTAENLAKYWFELIKIPLENRKIKIHHVKVWETPTSTATYSVDNSLD
jgi:6-pyruvoyltetrahydropterin/6-carboxytetrahydropterin synthase